MNASEDTTSHTLKANSDTKSCVACRELIKIDAKVCPHCLTSQSPDRWKIVGNALKWIAGITAVITLIVGMAQINSLYQNWRERQEAVTELVKAAGIQSKSGDYEGAWKLVEEALLLESGSLIARKKQVQLAMEWLRTISISKNQKVTETIDKLLPTLYRGVANVKAEFVANAFAHLGWADHLRYREGMKLLTVDNHFAHSLEIDDKNVYAHAMWGYWILRPESKEKYGEDRLELSKSHFSKALKTGREREYIRRLQIQALLDTDALNDEVAEVETIKLANELRKNNERLCIELRLELLETYRILLFEGEHDRAVRLPELLFSSMPTKELLETFLWLSEDIDYVHVKPIHYDISVYKFIIARLTEEMGDTQKALSQYKSLQSEIEGWHSIQVRIDKAIQRISSKVRN
ncbi:MAG: hypothetical protein JSW07_02405 [bacterium]|nr:MAG: hypothetical protein JSW07_02405 [bacterium]